jgi:hypothetical protein
MRARARLAAALALLAFCGCRHVVVERDVGRIDGDLSISTSSDLGWKVVREPAPAADAAGGPWPDEPPQSPR